MDLLMYKLLFPEEKASGEQLKSVPLKRPRQIRYEYPLTLSMGLLMQAEVGILHLKLN